VFSRLGSAEQGLTSETVAHSLQVFGPNELPVSPPEPAWKRFLNQFRNVLIYVLLASAVISMLLDHAMDSGVIVLVVLLNAIVGYIQEGKAERALRAIKAMTRTRCLVLRNGAQISVDSAELVPGDVVILQAGDRVPADIRLFFTKNLRCDESALTGESQPVSKLVDTLPEALPLAERRNMAYMGTIVTFGVARGVVTSTGVNTEIGSISEMVQSTIIPETPLQKQLAHFATQLSVVIVLVSLLCMAFGMLVRGYGFADMFQAAISIAVATIPEGLPAIVTIALAIGVQRMAKEKALVRRLPSVEVLGAVDVICTDKTGTLTTNEMTVRQLVCADGRYHVTGEGYRPEGAVVNDDSGETVIYGHNPLVQQAALCSMLCNDANVSLQDTAWSLAGDPTEGALLVFAMKTGLINDDVRRDWRRLDELPFESERRYMATLNRGSHQSGHGDEYRVFVKGSPDVLFDACRAQLTAHGEEPFDQLFWTSQADQLAAEGHRVIAQAQKALVKGEEHLDHELISSGLTLIALAGIKDPPRPEAIASIKACHAAGVTVKMITGDNPLTAATIGQELGLDTKQVLTGMQLDQLDQHELAGRLEEVNIFARTSPANKLHLVRSLQEQHHVVAMTGDGVNDAPALRQSEIGVAMGLKGTDAAREAADIILLDDQFSTIATAVKEGRTVYDNVVKSIVFILPTSLAEAMVVILAIMLGSVLPITPAQILWINMVTTVTLALAIGFESAEPGIMDRPPRAPGQQLITRTLLLRMALVVLVSASVIFWLFTAFLEQGASLELSRTVAINTLVLIEAVYLLNCRFLHAGIFTWRFLVGIWPSLIAIFTVVMVQLGFTYLPLSQKLFGLETMSAKAWLVCISASLPILFIVEIEKFILRSRGSH